jgi:hypothetical protein
MKLAEILGWLNHARVIPRLSLGFYTYQMWVTQQWFMALKDPTPSQAAFTATVWGVYPMLLNFYMQGKADPPPTPAITDLPPKG